MIELLGRLLRPIRAAPSRSPLAGQGFDTPRSLTVTSPAFGDGTAIPSRYAGHGVGDNISPALHWTGVPADTAALLLLLDDIDVPFPIPLLHSVAVLEPAMTGLPEGAFTIGTSGVRIVPTLLSKTGYAGPRPIPGHGAHRYRFHVLALDHAPAETASPRAVLRSAAGHVLARGTLTGTYER